MSGIGWFQSGNRHCIYVNGDYGMVSVWPKGARWECGLYFGPEQVMGSTSRRADMNLESAQSWAIKKISEKLQDFADLVAKEAPAHA